MEQAQEKMLSKAMEGALSRAEQLPECAINSHDPLSASWDHNGLWFDQWGKNETE